MTRMHTWTSTFDMLPTTLYWLSTTARDEIPSSFMILSASFRGRSPLVIVSKQHLRHCHFHILDRYQMLAPNAQVPV